MSSPRVSIPLKKVLDSQLARSILLSFFALAIIEGSFLATLSVLIVRADKKASEEFQQLYAINAVSQLVQTFADILYAVILEEKLSQPGMIERMAQWLALSDKQYVLVRDAFRRANYSPSGLDALEADFLYVQALSRRAYQAGVPLEERRKFVKGTGDAPWRIANKWLSQWRSIASSIEAQPTPTSVDTNQAIMVLKLTIGSNVAALLWLLFFANRGLIVPLRRLAANCEKLESAEIMERPRVIRNEIGSLEESFFQLSSIIFEDKRQRLSNAEMLSAVQTTTLDRLRLCFQQLKGYLQDNDRAQRKMESSLVSIERLRALLESLSETLLSKHTVTALNPGNCTTTHLIDAALSATESLCEHYGIAIIVKDTSAAKNTDNKDAKASIGSELIADELLIVRVLVNLLSNAIKFSPRGQQIILSVDRVNQMLCFRVTDRGPGISPSDLQQLFKPFKQVEGTGTNALLGTGLGLSSCKDTIEKHHGSIGCESTVGEGSSFWFTIPVEPTELNESTANAQNGLCREGSPQSSIGTLLILMLLSFLLPQVILFANLNTKFQEVMKQAKQFKEEKRQFVLMGDQLYRLLDWRNEASKTVNDPRLFAGGVLLTSYKEMMNQSKIFYNDSASDEFVHSQLRQIMKEQKAFFREFVKVSSDIRSVYENGPLLKKATDISDKTLGRIFHLLRYQSAKAETAYTLSNNLSNDILATVAAAAVFDAVALISLSILGLRVTDTISQLKRKAESFAKGEQLEKTLRGSDELAFLEKRLVDASLIVSQAQREKQMLLTVINHDLRTPLASILATLAFTNAGMYGRVPDSIKTSVSEAERDSFKLLNRINNLLTLEKIDASAFRISHSTFSLRECLDTVLAQSATGIRSKALMFEIHDEAKDTLITGDQALFETMLIELINNAIEAAPSESAIHVTTRCDTKTRIEIQDRGVGVDQKLKPFIFDRFRFIDGKPLVGLGLPLAKRIAKLHSGDISIQSEQLSGTNVILELPTSANQ